MLNSVVALGALLASALGAAPSATPPPATHPVATLTARVLPAPTPERLHLAEQAAALALPEQLMIDAVLAGWERGQQGAKSDMDALEAVSPGLSTAIMTRGKAELLSLLRARLPNLRARIMKVYATSLTADELRSTLIFYGSATGEELIRKMVMSGSGDSMTDDLEVTAGEMVKANRQAARESVDSFASPQKAELIRFGLSPAGRAMQGVGAKVQPIAAEWMTGLMHDYDVRITPIIDKIVTDAIQGQ